MGSTSRSNRGGFGAAEEMLMKFSQHSPTDPGTGGTHPAKVIAVEVATLFVPNVPGDPENRRRSERTVDYVSALVPPIVMAVAFTCLVVTMIKNQGGANKSKEDAAVDAALAQAEATKQAATSVESES
jgi:hypothetical protein